MHDVNLLDEISAAGIIKDSVLFGLRKITLKNFLEQQKTKLFLSKKAFFSDKAKKMSEQKLVLLESFVDSLEEELK